MVRTRVHNLFVSSDGYAAGDYVTLEKPIGGAGRFSASLTAASSTASMESTTP